MNTQRVLALAAHLEALGETKPFDFGIVVDSCGSVGCALWDARGLWPDEFPLELYKLHNGLLAIGPTEKLRVRCTEWLDLSLRDYKQMFIPGYSHLSMHATREEVADNMRDMVKKYLLSRSDATPGAAIENSNASGNPLPTQDGEATPAGKDAGGDELKTI